MPHPSKYPSSQTPGFLHLSICLSLYICLSCPFLCASSYPCIFPLLSICAKIDPSYIHVSIHPTYKYLSIYPLYIHLSIHAFIICPSVQHPSYICLSANHLISICPFNHPRSICLFSHLSLFIYASIILTFRFVIKVLALASIFPSLWLFKSTKKSFLLSRVKHFVRRKFLEFSSMSPADRNHLV